MSAFAPTGKSPKKRSEALMSIIDSNSKGRGTIKHHEGKKYLRRIYPALDAHNDPEYDGYDDGSIDVDVYAVLKAFNVTCPATAHCIKKLLCAGERGKGDKLADLKGAMAALNRAIDFAEQEK